RTQRLIDFTVWAKLACAVVRKESDWRRALDISSRHARLTRTTLWPTSDYLMPIISLDFEAFGFQRTHGKKRSGRHLKRWILMTLLPKLTSPSEQRSFLETGRAQRKSSSARWIWMRIRQTLTATPPTWLILRDLMRPLYMRNGRRNLIQGISLV